MNKFSRKHATKNAFIKYALLAILCLLPAALFMSGCTKSDAMFKESRVLMDTYCTITVVSPSKELAREAIEAGFAEIRKLEILLNYFSDDSEITAANRASGEKPVKVSRETLEIIEKTLEIYHMTSGAFDPTISPVIRHWNFSKSEPLPTVPSEDEINRALQLVGYSKVDINSSASEIMLPEAGMALDLGGIAKGFGADKAVDAIKAKGIKAALVAIAGDIRGYGVSASGQPWKVGIQDPRPDPVSDKPWEHIFAGLSLKDSAISTSGDYQRFFIKDGRRYHHILDPGTGFPAESDLISVSVIAPEGYLSDSLSTAVFILGAEKGLSLLNERGYGGVLVTKEKKVFLTSNLKEQIEILNNDYELRERQLNVLADE